MFSVNSAEAQPAAEFRLQNAGKDYHNPKKDIINHKRGNIKSQLPKYVNICTYNTQTLLGPNTENLIEELHPTSYIISHYEGTQMGYHRTQ